MATEPQTYGLKDTPQEPTRCVEEVYSDWVSHQCSRKRGHGDQGRYCKQHAKRKQDAIDREKKWRDKIRLERELGKLLQGDAVFLYAMAQMATDLYNYEFQPKAGYPEPPDGKEWIKQCIQRELDDAKKVRIKR